MFKSAAIKIAHNTTLPALAGNQDLRPLQDLITAEKAVIISLQKLSTDFSKASEALKTWGLGEGEDLGNTLSASTTIFTHLTSALSQYAAHGHTMREQLKAVRAREESLDELRRRRRNVASKADSAEKKLQKMGPEHKNLTQQTDQLNRLREEIRGLDVEIMREEAAIGDFKRLATRSWVGLKFGGLLECCEKGVIVGEYGKLIISEIPEDETQPGLPRNQYFGHAKIEELVAEAHRCANEVRLSTVPSSSQPHRLDEQLPPIPGVLGSLPHGFQQESFSSPVQAPLESYRADSPARNFLPEPVGLGAGRFSETTNDAQPQPQYSGSLTSAPTFQSGPGIGRRVDEFGSGQQGGPINDSAAAGGRFATFPVKGRSGSMSTADNVGVGSELGEGGSGVAAAGGLGGYEQFRSDDKNRISLVWSTPQRQESDSFSSSVAKALAASSSTDPASRDDTPAVVSQPGRFSRDGPAPAYELPPENENPWTGGAAKFGPGQDDHHPSPTHGRNVSNISNLSQGNGGLAYLSTGGDDQVDDKHISRHVRFGDVSQIHDSPLPPMTPQDSALPSPATPGPSMAGQQSQNLNQNQPRRGTFDDRAPTLVPKANREDQERALDAAAAREIALELHSPSISQLSFNESQPPPLAPTGQRDLSISPSIPPAAPYMSGDRKSVSPRPEYNAPASLLERAPTYTEHPPTISVQQHGPGARSVTPLTSPPSQYGTPLSYSSQTPTQQVPGAFETHRSSASYEQEYNPYEDGKAQGHPGNNSGGGEIISPSFDPQPPNAPYMRSATGNRGSTSSLAGSTGSGGGGKISAAAFKRPAPRPGPGGTFGPPSPTARFSSSASPMVGGGGGGSATEVERLPSPYEGSQVPPPSPYGQGQGQGQMQPQYMRRRGDDETDQYQQEYGYDNPQGSYYAEQQQRTMNTNVAGGGWAGIGSGGGGPGPIPGGRAAASQGGYGQGRFATNLDNGLM